MMTIDTFLNFADANGVKYTISEESFFDEGTAVHITIIDMVCGTGIMTFCFVDDVLESISV